ncbi:DUF4369 domain-containing protein [uncultured Lutibacter sp.]|uniref:DUF4369 domain-containing protein n=1 Tax=uncultured Lutibacter sp. TaxID=437739 RepID=UPI002624D7FA|nr:DUF4369 domain-containing protein [uncultured Lutibacter sp.]
MKKYLLIYLASFLFFSCNSNNSKSKENITSKNNGFVLQGEIQNFDADTIYLNKIIENSIYKIDSSAVFKNNFTFKGVVNVPERFALTFNKNAAVVVLVIENSTFKIVINANEIQDPIITGSELNLKLNEYKQASKNIFKKISYLFPHFQKARLENDAEKLTAIGNDMKKIENEFTNYSFKFIENNKNSFIAAMVLRDQIKASDIDTLRVKESFQILSDEVKNSPDGLLVKDFLQQ